MPSSGFDSINEFIAWAESLPPSKMIYPRSFTQRLRYYIWRIYTPLHPFVRDTAIKLEIVRHSGRQDFLLGRVNPKYSFKDLVKAVAAKGFGNHFVAWKDDGEILSLRRVEDFVYQYHLRLYEDGEVRGHYELTPECHPIRHMNEAVLEARRDYFAALFGDLVL